MTVPIPQFILDFPISPICTFDNLVVGRGNREAAAALANLEGVTATGVGVTGEGGTGKTHLLMAAVADWRRRSGGSGAIYLDLAALGDQLDGADEQELGRFVQRHAGLRLAAVDDLEKLASSPALQEGVLYLFNRLHAEGGRLLFACRTSPRLLDWMRPDLRSRLLWGPVFPIDPPQEEELGPILLKLARDRQVRLSPDLVGFLQLRLPRRVGDYIDALERLDRAGLGLQRPLTVPLAKEVLGL